MTGPAHERSLQARCTCAKWLGLFPHGPFCESCLDRATARVAKRMKISFDLALALLKMEGRR